MKDKVPTIIGVVGLGIILVLAAATLGAITFNSVRNVSSGESFIIAFGGAFFAYVFVKFGELFTRISLREKLNIDTLVEIQYILNDHFYRIGTNIRIADAFIQIINSQSPAINVMRFKPIPHEYKSNLRNIKNIDYINDVFTYLVDIESINDGLEVVQGFAQSLINSVPKSNLTPTQQITIQEVYIANASELNEMVRDSKKLLNAAEDDCVKLLAKNEYIIGKRNRWLYLAIPWFNISHYDQADMDKQLPKLIKKIEKGRKENTENSVQKIKDTLRKKV